MRICIPATTIVLVLFVAVARASQLALNGQSSDDCGTAVEGDHCHNEVVWAMQTGILAYPNLYGNLTPQSSVLDFQQHLHDHVSYARCPAPCEMSVTDAPSVAESSKDVNSSGSDQDSFSAAGLQRLLQLKDATALEGFVERLIQSDGRMVRSQSGLKAFVDQTLQRTDLQRDLWDEDFDIFRTKVRSVAWVDPGIGRMAAFTAAGYGKVVATMNRQHMANYLRRVLDRMGKTFIDEAKFSRSVDVVTNNNLSFDEAVAMMAAGSFEPAS
eukprot:TRINITY_DN711_c0_g3_i1.p1 TRINITY_DN711_c0_g3~~TRINITY_DN711_c0_g3_i1.p1  ORF type:complete len:270 (-),score=45.97 TRINITY_DN711_c0_g3_i1:62-871(-)